MPPNRPPALKVPASKPGKAAPKDSQLAIEALTVEEISRSGKFSPAHVRNLIASGDLPSFSVGRCRRVLLTDYLAFLERLKQESRRGFSEEQ